MSVRAKVDPDFDPDDLDEEARQEQRRRSRQRWDQEDDEDEDEGEKKRRREKANEQRKEIRRRAEYMAQTQGGYVDEWIFLLTPRGRPFRHGLQLGCHVQLHLHFRLRALSVAAMRAQEQQEGKNLPASPAGVPVGEGQI